MLHLEMLNPCMFHIDKITGKIFLIIAPTAATWCMHLSCRPSCMTRYALLRVIHRSESKIIILETLTDIWKGMVRLTVVIQLGIQTREVSLICGNPPHGEHYRVWKWWPADNLTVSLISIYCTVLFGIFCCWGRAPTTTCGGLFNHSLQEETGADH